MCQVFRPIIYDRLADTEGTIEQVREHNAAWCAICGQGDQRCGVG